MSNFINKHFKRDKALKVIALGTDRSIRTHYVIPSNNTFTLYSGKSNVQTFAYNPDKVYRQKKFNTVYVVEGEGEVVDMFTHKAAISANEFAVVMENEVMKQFVKANSKENPNLILLLLFATLGALAITIYFLYDMQGTLRRLVDSQGTVQFIANILRR